MLFFVMGPPGRFVEGCEALVGRLVERALGSAELTSGNTLEEIARNLLRSGLSHGVVVAYQPGGRLRRALVESGRSFIVALDDPRAVLADMVRRRGIAMATATQMVASSCAASLCFRETPGALVLQADRDGRDRLSLAQAIAGHLQLDLDSAEIGEIVRSLGEADPAPEVEPAADWWGGLEQAERTIAGGALDAYLDISAGRELGPFAWSPGLFFMGDRPTEHVTSSIDITGRVRCLLRGPRILLPPGNWSLSVALHVSPEAAEHSFLLEVTAGAPLSRISIRPTDAGMIRADLTLSLEELPDRPTDLALSTERAAFGGHLSLLGVTLTRQPSPPPATAGAPESEQPQAAV
ncbi:MAG: hypothetical protein ACREE9_18670, partial [Stellaceae bacterium]